MTDTPTTEIMSARLSKPHKFAISSEDAVSCGMLQGNKIYYTTIYDQYSI